MKPVEKKPEEVYRIIARATGIAQGSYSRSCHNEFDFKSPAKARAANCHDVFQNKELFKIAKYKITYELIEDDVS